MRTIKLIILSLIGLGLMLVLSANMAPVDLHLLPAALKINLFSLTGIPLSLVIVAAVLVGFVIGLLMEFLRESKHRGNLARKRRELAELREENARLSALLEEKGEELAVIAA